MAGLLWPILQPQEIFPCPSRIDLEASSSPGEVQSSPGEADAAMVQAWAPNLQAKHDDLNPREMEKVKQSRKGFQICTCRMACWHEVHMSQHSQASAHLPEQLKRLALRWMARPRTSALHSRSMHIPASPSERICPVTFS
jgi:hypothetical protein